MKTKVFRKSTIRFYKNYPKKNKYILCTLSSSLLSALFIWFLTVLTEIFISSAISSYFIPSLFARRNTFLHFTGSVSSIVHIRASSKERSSHSSSEIISSRSEGRILLSISVSSLNLSIHLFLTIVKRYDFKFSISSTQSFLTQISVKQSCTISSALSIFFR